MFIEVHRKKDGEPLLLNSEAIESVTDHAVYVLGGTGDPYTVRETLAELSQLLEPRRLGETKKAPTRQIPVRALASTAGYRPAGSAGR